MAAFLVHWSRFNKHLWQLCKICRIHSIMDAFTLWQCVHMMLPSRVCACRPEADDVKALKQELTTLHVLLEETTGEQEKQLTLVSSGRAKAETEVEQWVCRTWRWKAACISCCTTLTVACCLCQLVRHTETDVIEPTGVPVPYSFCICLYSQKYIRKVYLVHLLQCLFSCVAHYVCRTKYKYKLIFVAALTIESRTIIVFVLCLMKEGFRCTEIESPCGVPYSL